jgi:hypothetical protein
MMLRPRDDEDQKIIHADLTISPKPQEVAWNRDQFDNHFAIARFSEQSDRLSFVSNIRLDHVARQFLASNIEGYAQRYPFDTSQKSCHTYNNLSSQYPSMPDLNFGAIGFFRSDGSAETYDLLTRMTETIFRTFRHINRHEEGFKNPLRVSRSKAAVVAILPC